MPVASSEAGVSELLGVPSPVPSPRIPTRAAIALDPRGSSPLPACIAALAAVLFRYDPDGPVWVGVSGLSRVRAADEGGSSAAVLPLRVDVDPDASFEDAVAQCADRLLELTLAVPAGSASADGLGAPVGGGPSALPRFQVVVAWDTDADVAEDEVLTIRVGSGGAELRLEVEYGRGPAGPVRAHWIDGHLRTLLEAGISKPREPLSALPMMTREERRIVTERFSGETTEYPRDATVTELFGAQVERSPDAVALDDGRETLTYRDLNERAERLAVRLRGLGVERGDRVGVFTERSFDMVVAVLGAVKAGGVYVPLEPSHPRERVDLLVSDTGTRVVVAQSHLAPRLEGVRRGGRSGEEGDGPAPVVVLIDEPDSEVGGGGSAALEGVGGADDPIYVMYTSGSTGRPKGVTVPHRAVVRLVRNTNYVDLGPDERVLGYAPLSFDASTFEIWGALLNGGCLAIVPPGLPTLDELGRFIQDRRVTTAWLTSALFHRMVDQHLDRLTGVRQLLAGGDVVSARHVVKVVSSISGCRVVNGYGPTENTTFTCCHIVTSADDVGETVPIGRPVANTRVYVLDERMEPVPVGVPGELFAGGDGLAQGYLGLPDRTAERFVVDPLSGDPKERLYRTGDRVRFLADGRVEFLGRLDRQVKIRGFRIEPGEVESALLGHEAVRECAVVPSEAGEGKVLVAYVAVPDGTSPDPSELREVLRRSLPEHMVPSRFVFLDHLPVTGNGKLDRSALPDPHDIARDASTARVSPSSAWEERLLRLWERLLGVKGIGTTDGFFDVGGNSLLALQMVEDLRREHDVVLPIAKLFQYPTVGSLAAHLSGSKTGETAAGRARRRVHERFGAGQARVPAREGIAVIGMAGRFPGAANVDELWEVLCDRRETTTFFLDTPEGLDPSIPVEVREAPGYVAARGILDGADLLDAGLFGVNPRLAQVTDPQHRVFLQTAWEALESAGYAPGAGEEVIGIYAGMGYNNYFPRNVAPHGELVHSLGELRVQLANEKDYVAIAAAHRLDLRGPAVSVHTACSTSLTAVAHACQALLFGQCDMALAGGVAVTVPQRSGHVYQEGGMLSADGHCRPFDARATGTVFSDGSAAVVLKRLSDAERDGDTIYAVIRGVGVSNDGAERASFTAPTVDGQAAAISTALAQAGWSADTVTFVETHGTATPLGDPIEVEALTQAFRASTDRTGFCALGSLKSNVGHLTAAAGVAGLIKAVLAIRHRKIPGTLHFESPNPKIDFERSPFFVNAEAIEWNPDGLPRRAGVSSFGVGGTNVHVVLEEYPHDEHACSARTQLLLLSARSPSALDAATRRLRERLEREPETSLADTAYTLQVGRRRFRHRRFVVTANTSKAVDRLARLSASHVGTGEVRSEASDVVFAFPGQGVQYPGMARDLYEGSSDFRADLDRCADILRDQAGLNLISMLFADGEEAADALARTAVTQPAVFSVEWALARLWLRWGLEPGAMVGHSLGELGAACVAGVLTLEDALEVVAARGRLIEALPPGSMLSVRAPAEWVLERLPEDVSLAGDNAPGLVAVSGPSDRIAALQRAWTEEGVRCRELRTSHAFHSAMMDAAMDPFREVVERVHLFPPEIPIMSSVTGAWLTAEQATSSEYWVRHIREPVRFGPAVTALASGLPPVFVEVGPRASATALIEQCLGASASCIASLEGGPGDGSEWDSILRAAGRLWLAGFELDWSAVHGGERRHRIALPTYPFEGKRFWIEPPAAGGPASSSHAVVTGEAAPAARDTEVLLLRQLRIIRGQLELLDRAGVSLHSHANGRADSSRRSAPHRQEPPLE